METAPTSVEVLLRPTIQTIHDAIRGSLSPTTQHRCTHVLVYTAPGVCQVVTHPIMDQGPALLNFSDRANTHKLMPYSVFVPEKSEAV